MQGTNNVFRYNFPQSSYFSAGSKIGVSNIAIYNSIFNMTEKRGNNKLNIHWLGIDYDIIIPDCFYSISQLNSFIQNWCIINNLYVSTNDNEDFVYFLELIVNSVRYGSSLIFYSIPTAEEASDLKYVKPTGATWDFPSESESPTLSFNQGFGNLIGFTFDLNYLVQKRFSLKVAKHLKLVP
jgi:hypothetical protein